MIRLSAVDVTVPRWSWMQSRDTGPTRASAGATGSDGVNFNLKLPLPVAVDRRHDLPVFLTRSQARKLIVAGDAEGVLR